VVSTNASYMEGPEFEFDRRSTSLRLVAFPSLSRPGLPSTELSADIGDYIAAQIAQILRTMAVLKSTSDTYSICMQMERVYLNGAGHSGREF
jgi:hypothetical protein